MFAIGVVEESFNKPWGASTIVLLFLTKFLERCWSRAAWEMAANRLIWQQRLCSRFSEEILIPGGLVVLIIFHFFSGPSLFHGLGGRRWETFAISARPADPWPSRSKDTTEGNRLPTTWFIRCPTEFYSMMSDVCHGVINITFLANYLVFLVIVNLLSSFKRVDFR